MAVTSATHPCWVLVLDDIDEGISQRRFPVRAVDLDVDDGSLRFDTPFDVDLRISRTLQTYSLQGRVRGTVRGECSRCLAAAQASFDIPWRLFLQRREAEAEELAAVADQDELLVVDPGVKEVSLAPLLRDSIVLELPFRICCRPDCKGLCGQCGTDLNEGTCQCVADEVDPRWAALAGLKQEN